MPPDLVIFDCDGVLVDSEPVANRILATAISDAGHAISVAETRTAFVGTSMSHVMETVERWIGRALPAGWLDQLATDTFAAFRNSLDPVAGVRDVVLLVQASGTDFCVASSGPIEKIELTLGLTGLRPLFGENIFSSTMVARGKPHPDIFLYAAQQMGVSPERCTVIEDSIPGVTGACAAGMRTLAYAGDPQTDADALAVAGGIVFRKMTELPNLLNLR